nr:hypothetical protein HK105_002227 [Polyrhizophydium stewartii]
MDGDGAGDYWDLDAILAQQSLPKGAVVELPFWLAESLGVAGIAGLEMPACFGEQVQAELTASPESLQLSLLAPDFFYFFADYLRIM